MALICGFRTYHRQMRVSSGIDQSRRWALFADWCAAAEVDPMTAGAAEIACFVTDMPAAPSTQQRRVDAIRTVRRAAGTPDPLPPPAPDRSEIIAATGHLLSGTIVSSWPDGVRGCRDGFVLVLRGHLGLSRAQVRRLQALDVTVRPGAAQVWGQSVSRTPDPGSCPVCGISRWLRILDADQEKGWRSVRAVMAGDWAAPAWEQTEHDCLQPLRPAWSQVAVLVPPVDRHGWIGDVAPLSVRSLSTVTSRRPRPANSPVGPECAPAAERLPCSPATSWSRVGQVNDLAYIDPLMEDLDAQIDAALARSQAALSTPGQAV